MRRILSLSILAATMLAIVAMGMGVGLTAAADANETASDEYEVEFGNDTRILEYEFENETARVTFDTDVPQTVVVADALAGIDQNGVSQVPEQEYNLETGESTITMDVVSVRGGMSISVAIDGTTVRLSTELDDSDTDDNPFETFGGESGLFFGTGMATGLAGLGAVIVIRQEESGVIEA